MLDLQLYQYVVLGLALYMIWQGGIKYFKHEGNQTFMKFAVRVIVWGGMAAIATFPNLSNDVAKFIGIAGNINAVILVGFILIFLIIFKLLSAIETLEQQISVLTRKDAIGVLNQTKNKNE